MATSQGSPSPSQDRPDPLAGIDVPRIRVEGAICDALEACDKVSRRADELDAERGHAVGQAVHAARLSLVEALPLRQTDAWRGRRPGRAGSRCMGRGLRRVGARRPAGSRMTATNPSRTA
ncbi:MAG: hypothetical protein ACRD0W_13755 [Acidimicrobiales bacterium]